jgi:hypothetical protein
MNVKGKAAGKTTDICYVLSSTHNKYLPQFILFIRTVSFTINIFSTHHDGKSVSSMKLELNRDE